MKVEINQILFKKLVDSSKHNIDETDRREALRFIRLVVSKDTITAYGCDGFQANKTVIKLNPPVEEEFTCFIKPIPIKLTKDGIETVVISIEDEFSCVEVPTEYGKVKYKFKQPTSEYFDIEKVFEGARVHDREVGLDAGKIIKCMRAITSVSEHKNNLTILETKDSKTAPILFRSKEYWGEIEQIILPIRYV